MVWKKCPPNEVVRRRQACGHLVIDASDMLIQPRKCRRPSIAFANITLMGSEPTTLFLQVPSEANGCGSNKLLT